MKCRISLLITAVILLSFPVVNSGQAPDLGNAAGFVLFTTAGAVTNTGISHITGNVGTSSGSNTGFGNVNGVMNANDYETGLCSADLLIAYHQLDTTTATFSIASSLGGDTLVPGVYAISGGATLNLDLTLDAEGDSNAVFIFQIAGPLSTSADSRIRLIKSAKACQVFWKVEGLVSMASGTIMKGTIIANNSAINMSTGVALDGRALSINGAISVDGVLAYTPVGCGSPILTGPDVPPALSFIECYAIFSSIGEVTNTGITYVNGDVGSNDGLTTGFNPLFVTGTIHPIADASTATCATHLHDINNYLDILLFDIKLLYSAQFGNSLVLTPHTYIMNGAVTFTDTLFLNAQGNADAVFVIQVFGALSTSTHSQVVLMNGTQAKNVFWKVEGAVDINDSSVFKGTLVCNNGAINLGTGVTIEGRVLTTDGAYNTAAITTTMTPVCANVGISPLIAGNTNEAVTVYPNPFSTHTTIMINDALQMNQAELRIYNIWGAEVMKKTVTDPLTTLDTSHLLQGIYFFRLILGGVEEQSGILVSQQ